MTFRLYSYINNNDSTSHNNHGDGRDREINQINLSKTNDNINIKLNSWGGSNSSNNTNTTSTNNNINNISNNNNNNSSSVGIDINNNYNNSQSIKGRIKNSIVYYKLRISNWIEWLKLQIACELESAISDKFPSFQKKMKKHIDPYTKRIKNWIGNYYVQRIWVCMQVVLLAYLMSKAVFKFQMLDHRTTIDQFSNTECSMLDGKHVSPECKSGYNFNRVLFFYNDGLARDLSDNLIKLYESNANTFRIQNEGFPASYAVFTTYMSGSAPTNFMGTPLQSDNLIYQLTHNNISMNYYGTRMPAYDILEKGSYFKSVKIEQTTPTSTLYSTLFGCGKGAEECANSFLDLQKQESSSVFFSGDIVDERNHQTGDKLDPKTLETIELWVKDMAYVKKWIDNNPEYLLVVFSDHGGKLTSETSAHGKNNDGNEAFMMIYNPNLEPMPHSQQDKFIDQVDVCSTIWQYFSASGISLPAENIGKVKPTMSDPNRVYDILKLNADQFNQLSKKWNYNLNNKLYKKAEGDKEDDINESIQLFSDYINSLKIPFLNLKRFPLQEVIFFPIIIVILIISLMRKQYGSLKNLAHEFRFNFELVFIPYLVIFGLSGLFSGFWVLFWHDQQETIHVYIASLMAALVMYHAPKATLNSRLGKLINNSNSNNNIKNNDKEGVEEIEMMDYTKSSCETSPILTSSFNKIKSKSLQSPIIQQLQNNESTTKPRSPSLASSQTKVQYKQIDIVDEYSPPTQSPLLLSIQLNNSGSHSPMEKMDILNLKSPDISTSTTKHDKQHQIQQQQHQQQLQQSSNQNVAYEYKTPGVWLMKYAFFNFFMAVCLYLLTVPLEDLLLVHFYKYSYLIGGFFLMLEFYIQRRKVYSHFVGDVKERFGSFLPLHIKFITYTLILIGIYFYDKQWREHHHMLSGLAAIIYFILAAHSIVLLFCPKSLQADIFLPFSMILFFLSNDKERFYLLLFVIPQLYCISNMFYYKLFNTFQPILTMYRNNNNSNNNAASITQNNTNITHIYNYTLNSIHFFSGITDHFLPFVVLLMTSIALSCYKSMNMNFQIGDVAIYVPGVYDPPSMPVFSGFIMAFHKLGYFFLLGSFLIKLSSPCPPALFPKKWFNNKYTFGFKIKSNGDYNVICHSLSLQIWGFLMLLLLCAIFFFHIGYYNFMITKAFVFTVTISVIVIFYGVSLVTSYIGFAFYTLLNMCIDRYSNSLCSRCLSPRSPSYSKLYNYNI